jgi:hypothetical protein
MCVTKPSFLVFSQALSVAFDKRGESLNVSVSLTPKSIIAPGENLFNSDLSEIQNCVILLLLKKIQVKFITNFFF